MTSTITFSLIALSCLILFSVFFLIRKQTGNKASLFHILAYVFLVLFLAALIFGIKNKLIIYPLLFGAIVSFGINQYRNMKKMGGNILLWLLPVILALLAVILFIVLKTTA